MDEVDDTLFTSAEMLDKVMAEDDAHDPYLEELQQKYLKQKDEPVLGHIAIKLNPRELSNLDLDIRYVLPDLIQSATGNRVRDNGYDYSDGDNLIIYLSSPEPAIDVASVLEILRGNKVCENRLLDTATVATSSDGTTFKIVHPATGGQFKVDPW